MGGGVGEGGGLVLAVGAVPVGAAPVGAVPVVPVLLVVPVVPVPMVLVVLVPARGWTTTCCEPSVALPCPRCALRSA